MRCTKNVAMLVLFAVCGGCAQTILAPSPASYPFNIAQQYAVPCGLWFNKTADNYRIRLNRHPTQQDGSPNLLMAQGNFGALIKVQVTQGDRAPRGYDGTHAVTVIMAPDQDETTIRDLTVNPEAVIGLALDACEAYAPWSP